MWPTAIDFNLVKEAQISIMSQGYCFVEETFLEASVCLVFTFLFVIHSLVIVVYNSKIESTQNIHYNLIDPYTFL